MFSASAESPASGKLKRTRTDCDGVEFEQRLMPTPNGVNEAFHESCKNCTVGSGCSRCKMKRNQANKNARKKAKKLVLGASDEDEDEVVRREARNAHRRQSRAADPEREQKNAERGLNYQGLCQNELDGAEKLTEEASQAADEGKQDICAYKMKLAMDRIGDCIARKCARAYCVRAIIVLTGLNGIPADADEALGLLKVSADMGFAEAHLELGRALERPTAWRESWATTLEVDIPASQLHFKEAMAGCKCWTRGQCHHVDAALHARVELADSLRRQGDHHRALFLYQEAAAVEDDDTECRKFSLLRIGIAHEEGLGCEINLAESVRYIVQAAEEGERQAAYIIARLFSAGLGGCSKDLAQTRKYLKQSAELGYLDALIALAEALEHGFYGFVVNEMESLRFMRRAANEGSPEAQFKLHIMYQYRGALGDWRTVSQKSRLLSLAEKSGNIDALLTYCSESLGLCDGDEDKRCLVYQTMVVEIEERGREGNDAVELFQRGHRMKVSFPSSIHQKVRFPAISAPLVAGEPFDAHQSLNNAEAVVGCVCLLRRGTDTDQVLQQVACAEACGAVAVLLVDSKLKPHEDYTKICFRHCLPDVEAEAGMCPPDPWQVWESRSSPEDVFFYDTTEDPASECISWKIPEWRSVPAYLVSNAMGTAMQEKLEVQGTLSHFCFVNALWHSINETGQLQETCAMRPSEEHVEDDEEGEVDSDGPGDDGSEDPEEEDQGEPDEEEEEHEEEEEEAR